MSQKATSPVLTYPGEAQGIDGIGEHVAQQGSRTVESRKVGVHEGRLPVGDAWHDGRLEISKDLRPRLAVNGCRVGQEVLHVSGLHIRKDGARSNGLQVVTDVVDQFLACS